MSFTPGSFDVYAQVETQALDVAMRLILHTLTQQNRHRFTQNIGSALIGGAIDAQLTKLSVPSVRSLTLADRFRRGSTLTTFQVDANLDFRLRLLIFPIRFTDSLSIQFKDLQVGLFNTPGGLPVGVALGFQQFDIDVGGMSRFRNFVLNILVDFLALGIRTALSPLGLTPIPILQFADAFAKLGLAFDTANGSPFLGTTQTGRALFLTTDFTAANNTAGAISAVQDILPPGGGLTIGTVASQRVINQVVGTLLARGDLTRNLNTAGANFAVNALTVRFENPTARPAFIGVDGAASARVRARKGGFLGRLFGGSRRVTIRAYASLDLEAGVVQDPTTQLSVVDFAYAATLRARVTIHSVLAGVLTITLGPFLVVFLFLLTQILNFAIDFFLPLRFQFQVSGAAMLVAVQQLQVQLGLGPLSLSSATLRLGLNANGTGTFQLDHFTQHQIQNTGLPLTVDYTPDSLATQQGELFLGARPS